MTTFCRCDRCGEEIEPGKHSKGVEELIGSREETMTWDLCEMCDVELRRFMNGVKLVAIKKV